MGEFAGKRIVVMGLGRFGGGEGVARFCAERGGDVLVTDTLDETALAKPRQRLADLDLRYRLGGHDERDFVEADVVVVNPAVSPHGNLFLDAARQHGAELTSEIRLLVERLPNRQRTIGVTGTAGKSTTVAMIGHLLRAAGGAHRVWVGGNIGGSLLGDLESITGDDWVVLELSSFMLDTIGRWSPHIAVVTNVRPNHLDRHHTFDAYVRAKKTIAHHQRRDDRIVLGPGLDDWRGEARALTIMINEADPAIELSVPGTHNRLNATLALAAVEATGININDVQSAIRSFTGLPHRLQLVATRHGVRWFNDSKSTTPESAMLAVDAFEPGVVHLIAGGYDKGSDLTEMAHHAAARCAGLYAVGTTGDRIADAAEKLIESEGRHCKVERCGTLEHAVHRIAHATKDGDVVLLSPGCAAWDQFDHFEHRGDVFTQFATTG